MADLADNPSASSLDEESDEELLRAFLQQRNEDLFSRLVRRHEDFAYRLAFGYCGKPELAEEIAQESFMKVARESSSRVLEAYPSFKSWFSGVVMNVARHAVRTERRIAKRTQHPEFLAMQKRTGELKGENGVASGLDSETCGALRKALAELSDELRLPVVMHFVEGMSQEEIGAAAGVSQPTVSKRLQKGLDSLRVQLAQMGVAVTAVALPSILKSENLIQAPHFTHAARADLAARALSQADRSMRAAAAGGSHAVKIAVAMAAAVTLGLAAWIVSRPPQAPGPQASAAATATTQTPAAAADPLPLYWTFEKPETAGLFKINRGAWEWKAADRGRPACMSAPVHVLAELPFKVTARPFKVTVRYSPMRTVNSVNFGCYYLNLDGLVEDEAWAKRGLLYPEIGIKLEYFCYRQWVLCRQNGDPIYLSKYPQPYVSERIGVSLQHGEIMSIGVEALPQEEAARMFEHPEQDIETHGFKRIH